MKTVHWYLPFSDNNFKQYRVDIYSEGECETPIQLYGGESPFETSEDASDNNFEPIRFQTASLHIINNGIEDLSEMQPSSNTDKPIVLINKETGEVEWQGFIKCDKYSQQYVSRPHVLDLECISFLEALDSQEISFDSFSVERYCTLATLLRKAIQTYQEEELFRIDYVYYPKEDCELLNRKTCIDNFFEEKEIPVEGALKTRMKGCTGKELISSVCTFAGWVAREHGKSIVFSRIGGTMGFYKVEIADFVGHYLTEAESVDYAEEDMRSQEWMGNDHTISVHQGAREVTVESNIVPFSSTTGLPTPPCFDTNMQDALDLERVVYDKDEIDTVKTKLYCIRKHQGVYTPASASTLASNIWLGTHSSSTGTPGEQGYYQYFGAILARYDQRENNETLFSLSDGLMLLTEEYTGDAHDPILTMETNSSVPVFTRYIKIEPHIAMYLKNVGGAETPENDTVYLRYSVGRVGPGGILYWDGVSGWSAYHHQLIMKFNNDGLIGNWTPDTRDAKTNAIYIPTPEGFKGGVVFELYMPYQTALGRNYAAFFFDRIDVGYEPQDIDKYSTRNENIYSSGTNEHFMDEVSIRTEIASSRNNAPSPSLIYYDDLPAISVPYNTISGVIYKRPEKDLLERAIAYYSTPRNIITIKIKEPQSAPIQLLQLIGFDGKRYLPLSESRSWRTGVSTVQCFEVPE